MRKLFVISTVILAMTSSCGFNGTQKLETNDTNQNINVNFTFIQQLITLCRQSLLPETFATPELYNQAVAQCVFGQTANLNVNNNPVCQPGADLSGFTPDQQQNLIATCALLGGAH